MDGLRATLFFGRSLNLCDQLAPEYNGYHKGEDQGGGDDGEEHVGSPYLVDFRHCNGSDNSCKGTCGHENAQP